MDGKNFVGCTFENVSLNYNGTAPCSMDPSCRFDDFTLSHLGTKNPSLAQWAEIVRATGRMAEGTAAAINGVKLPPKQPIKPLAIKPAVFEYRGVVDGGERCFEAPMGVCSTQVAIIKNIQTAVPLTARNVRASIDYLHDGGVERVFVALAQWKNINPIGSASPGTTFTETLNLDSNEEQSLIVSIQTKQEGNTLLASPERGKQFQPLGLGHWVMIVIIEADNAPPLKLKGGLTVFRNHEERRNILRFDSPAFKIFEEAAI